MVKGVQKKPSFLDSSPCILNNPWTDWANNLGLVSFWRYLTGEYGKLPKWGVGAPRGPHGGPKGSKMAKIDQNLEFSDFCHHPFHSGKDFSIFLHRSNKERVAENGRWEWRPLGAKHGGTTGQKWLKLTKIFDFFLFRSLQFTLATNFPYFHTDLMWGSSRKWWVRVRTPGGPTRGPTRESQRSQNDLRIACPGVNFGHFRIFGTPWWKPKGSSPSSIIFYYSPA